MKNHEGLSHTRYDCKYHVVFIPKYRRKKIYGAIRRHLGEIFHELAKQKESRILERAFEGRSRPLETSWDPECGFIGNCLCSAKKTIDQKRPTIAGRY